MGYNKSQISKANNLIFLNKKPSIYTKLKYVSLFFYW